MSDIPARKGRGPVELLNIVGTAVAILVVVALGAALSSVLPQASPWLTAAAYLAPASVAFAAYWWIAQRS